MKTIFSRVLLAQVVVVVLALTVAAAITRISLHRGFDAYLERQENRVLQNLTPVLSEFYQRRGSWRSLRSNPEVWRTIWRMGTTAETERAQRPGESARRLPPEGRPPPPGEALSESGPASEFRWPGRTGRGSLRDRLFLLDQQKRRIAGPVMIDEVMADALLEPIVVDDETVGWVGFAPMGNVLPSEAERFLGGQVRIMALALAAALAVAVVLAGLLARTVSRPVRNIGGTVRRLSDGDYSSRSDMKSSGEMAELARNVNQLAESLERNRSARRRWMTDIAHELRTPVAVMKGEIEAVADGIREPGADTIASLAEEAEHLAMMVEDLHALALSDAGALDITKKTTDLSELVRQSAEAFEKRLQERGITLATDLPGECLLSCDPHRMRQLLQNLLENACRYTISGGTVRLALAGEGNVTLTVEDSGPGVSTEQLERLFERFYRIEESRARVTGGSGLGLAICRNIALAHGGTIRAEHGSMGGLAIRVTLPA